MKLIIFMSICATFSFANANENKEVELLNEVDPKLINEFTNFAQGLRIDKLGGITAEINEFIDRLFPNISNFCISHHLDPAPLDDVKEKFLLAKIEFLKGYLHGISSLVRYGDVTVGYQSKTKTLTLNLPIRFSNLSFTYDYSIKMFGIGPKGDLIGKVENFKFNLQLSFNVNTLTAQIDKLKTTDSGHISFIAHGNLTDVIFNILSQFITTFLHPLIQGIIEGIVKHVANNIVTDVNDLIYNITHPNDTTTYKFLQYPLN